MLTLSALLDGFRKGRVRRASLQTLRTLSPAQLRDIGIDTDHIGEVVDAMVDSTWERASPIRHAPVSVAMPSGAGAATVGCG